MTPVRLGASEPSDARPNRVRPTPPSPTGGDALRDAPEPGIEQDPQTHPSDALVRALWDRAGLASGHVWSPCDVCGEEVLQPRSGGRRCIVTSGCAGTHRPPANRPTPLQALRSGLIDIDDIRRHPPTEIGVRLRAAVTATKEQHSR